MEDAEDRDAPIQHSVYTSLGRAAAKQALMMLSRGKQLEAPAPPESVMMKGGDAMIDWTDGYEAELDRGSREMETAHARPSSYFKIHIQKRRKRAPLTLPQTLPEAIKEMFSLHKDVSAAVYAQVQSDFFMPDDKGFKLASGVAADNNVELSADDFNTYWNAGDSTKADTRGGAYLVSGVARSARSKVAARLREEIYAAHGAYARDACARMFMRVVTPSVQTAHASQTLTTITT